MNTTAQLLLAFFILCAAGTVLAFLVSQRWLPILLAVVGSLAALIILVASAMLLRIRCRISHGVMAGTHAGDAHSRDRPTLRVLSLRHRPGLSAGVALLRRLPQEIPRPL